MTAREIRSSKTLDARQASLFVQAATKFQSHIYVSIGESRVNGKSIMGLIALGVLGGGIISLQADGYDEYQALNELERFFL